MCIYLVFSSINTHKYVSLLHYETWCHGKLQDFSEKNVVPIMTCVITVNTLYYSQVGLLQEDTS